MRPSPASPSSCNSTWCFPLGEQLSVFRAGGSDSRSQQCCNWAGVLTCRGKAASAQGSRFIPLPFIDTSQLTWNYLRWGYCRGCGAEIFLEGSCKGERERLCLKPLEVHLIDKNKQQMKTLRNRNKTNRNEQSSTPSDSLSRDGKILNVAWGQNDSNWNCLVGY